MTFDFTVNWNHILTGAGLALGALGIVYTLRGDMRVIKSELDGMKAHMLKLTDALIHIGRQDERINSVERRLDRLEDHEK